MTELFHILIHDPLYNALIFLYNTIAFEDFGLAIIGITILLKLILLPLSKKQIESQRQLQELQPKIKALQEKYKTDKEKQAKMLMEFYKEHKVNPFGGCLPLIVQLVFLLAIYNIFLGISNTLKDGNFMVEAAYLYPFIHNPGQIHTWFLSFLDLSKPSIWLAVVTAGFQYWQTKMLMQTKEASDKKIEKKKEVSEGEQPDFSQMMMKQMLIIGPVLTLVIGIQFQSGLILYWLVSTIFMIVQQKYVLMKENLSSH